MIKYLVMGLYKLINKDTCTTCGKKLLVPSWRNCEDCDFNSYRNKYLRKQTRIEKTNLLRLQNQKLKKRKSMRSVNRENLVKAQIIVFDDYTGKVVGYRMF